MSFAGRAFLPGTTALLAAGAVALLLTASLTACDPAARAGSTGERVWLQNCAECHGVDAAGKVPKYRRYQYVDLLDDFWLNGGDDDSIANSITDGVRLIMPGFEHLTDEELNAVVGYIRELRSGR